MSLVCGVRPLSRAARARGIAPVGRGEKTSRKEASSAHRDPLRLDVEFLPFAERIWALRGNLISYDAWYVALAEALDCPLVTLDRRLGRASGPMWEMMVVPGS